MIARASVACRVCGVTIAGRAQGCNAPAFGALPTSSHGYGVGVCVECDTLDPERPGLAVRAALRILGMTEDDPFAAEAFEDARVDVLAVLFDRPDDPRRPPLRAPQREPFAHVGPEIRAELRAAYETAQQLRGNPRDGEGEAPAPIRPEAIPSGGRDRPESAAAQDWDPFAALLTEVEDLRDELRALSKAITAMCDSLTALRGRVETLEHESRLGSQRSPTDLGVETQSCSSPETQAHPDKS